MSDKVSRAIMDEVCDRALECAARIAHQYPAPPGHDLATFIRFRTEIAESIRALKSRAATSSSSATTKAGEESSER